MGTLTAKARHSLPKSAFVFPEREGYPIHDLAHARNALARASGKPEEAQVKAAVYRRYPELKRTQESAMSQTTRWVEREGQRFLVEADGKCAMPHAAMAKRGKKICPNCKHDLEGKAEDAKEKVEEALAADPDHGTLTEHAWPFVKDLDQTDKALAYIFAGAEPPTPELREAADSLMKASTHKHGLEVKKGKRDNWVERAGAGGRGGQLPAYIQHIALAIEKRGKTKSQAIAIAVGTVKRWAAGGGKVDSNTRAAAAKALSEWEALRARAHAK